MINPGAEGTECPEARGTEHHHTIAAEGRCRDICHVVPQHRPSRAYPVYVCMIPGLRPLRGLHPGLITTPSLRLYTCLYDTPLSLFTKKSQSFYMSYNLRNLN